MSYHYSLLRFVPDPARGEFVNFGVLLGDDDAQEWELRVLQNYRRAKAIDDAGVLNIALGVIAQIESHIDALEALPGLSPAQPISLELVGTLAGEMRNIVQITEPKPIAVESAQEGLEILTEELLVDPLSRQYPFERKNRAVGVTRRAYRAHDVPDESVRQRAPVTAGSYDGLFDFAIFNGQAVQLVQCWSFQLPDQAALAEQVKAWAWVVRELREKGGEAQVGDRTVTIPRGEDFDITAVTVLPLAKQEDAHAYDEARAAFAETHVQELQPERVDELAVRAAQLLHVAA